MLIHLFLSSEQSSFLSSCYTPITLQGIISALFDEVLITNYRDHQNFI